MSGKSDLMTSVGRPLGGPGYRQAFVPLRVASGPPGEYLWPPFSAITLRDWYRSSPTANLPPPGFPVAEQSPELVIERHHTSTPGSLRARLVQERACSPSTGMQLGDRTQRC
jgi:hypothetical protein